MRPLKPGEGIHSSIIAKADFRLQDSFQGGFANAAINTSAIAVLSSNWDSRIWSDMCCLTTKAEPRGNCDAANQNAQAQTGCAQPRWLRRLVRRMTHDFLRAINAAEMPQIIIITPKPPLIIARTQLPPEIASIKSCTPIPVKSNPRTVAKMATLLVLAANFTRRPSNAASVAAIFVEQAVEQTARPVADCVIQEGHSARPQNTQVAMASI
jgi:hypothetical protein